MLFKDAHLKFLDYLEVIKNKSPRTIEQYDRHLRKFGEFLIESKKLSLQKFEVEKIILDLSDNFRSYLYEKNRTISIKTANAYMITLRSFLKYLEKK
jgi:site-specific recombinase XerD